MDSYHLLGDALSTFRSVNDWIKALIVLGFYGSITAIAVTWILRPRQRPRADPSPAADPLRLTRLAPPPRLSAREAVASRKELEAIVTK